MELESTATGGDVNYSAVSVKTSAADLVTETDQEVEKMIKQMIHEHFPSHKFVGEETSAETGGKFTIFYCFQTKFIAIILVLRSFYVIFRLTDFSSEPFDFSSSKPG